MAFPIRDGLLQWISEEHIDAVAEKFLDNGLSQVIDLGMLDDADLHELFHGDDGVLSAVTRARNEAAKFKHGWCTLSAKNSTEIMLFLKLCCRRSSRSSSRRIQDIWADFHEAGYGIMLFLRGYVSFCFDHPILFDEGQGHESDVW